MIANYERNTTPVHNTPDYKVHQQYKELGAGYYRKLPRTMKLEVYAGYGTGSVNAYDNFTSLKNNMTPINFGYDRYFVQGVFAVSRKNFTLAPSVRVSYVTFKSWNDIDFDDSGNFYAEPCATGIFNARNSKNIFLSHLNVMAQAGFNLSLMRFIAGKERFRYEYGYAFFNASLGVGFRLGPIGGKKKSE